MLETRNNTCPRVGQGAIEVEENVQSNAVQDIANFNYRAPASFSGFLAMYNFVALDAARCIA